MLRLARLLAVPGLAVALAAAGIVLSVVGLPDDPPPADADLIVEFPEVPYEQNGYVALQEALERGEDFVSAVRAALELPFFQRPHFEVWEDIYYFTLSFYDLRTSFERLIEVAEGAGNHEAAFEAGLQAVEWAAASRRSQDSMSTWESRSRDSAVRPSAGRSPASRCRRRPSSRLLRRWRVGKAPGIAASATTGSHSRKRRGSWMPWRRAI